MTWHIGIDEAGYGPNLGPLVMTLVACQAPDGDGPTDLWQRLRLAVRRPGERAERGDLRPLVADSKQVYSPTRGMAALELGVLAALRGGFFSLELPTLHHVVEPLAGDHLTELRDEVWYAGTSPLPLACDEKKLQAAAARWRDASAAAGLTWGVCRSAIVCAPRFNALVERWDSKAAVLGLGLAQLVQNCVEQTADGTLEFVIDKHGGRNQYGVLLQAAFTSGLVLAEVETAERSVYRVEGMGRPVRVTFVPRADAGHFSVALASMVSKYLREALMGEFNAFWRKHVPDLKPTAGYPVDAVRYLAAIRPALGPLGLSEGHVWRCR